MLEWGWNWGTMSLIEILWTLMAAIGLGAALAGLCTAQQDLRAVERRERASPVQQRRYVLVARYTRRREAVSVFLQLVLTLVGARALVLPPNPASSEAGTFLIGGLFFTAAGLLTWCSVMERLDRRRFDGWQ